MGGIAGLITNLLPTIFGYFGNKNQNNAELEKAKIELQTLLVEKGADEFNRQIDLLVKQTEINAIEATNGKSGWRNMLCWGVAVAFLYAVIGLPVIYSLGALLSLVGVPANDVLMFQELLPVIDQRVITDLLYGLLGLYGIRETGKVMFHKNTTQKK